MTKKQLENLAQLYDQYGKATLKNKVFSLIVHVNENNPAATEAFTAAAGGETTEREFERAKVDSPRRFNYTWRLKGPEAVTLASALLPLLKDDPKRVILKSVLDRLDAQPDAS